MGGSDGRPTECVALLAVIAGTVSYLRMHQLVAEHGQPGWVAVLTAPSVGRDDRGSLDALLADSRSGGRGGLHRRRYHRREAL